MRVLFVEPFHGGSHGAFLDTLVRGLREGFGVDATVLTMPGRHWKWRMRGAVPWLAENHDAALRGDYDLVFASSFLALAELVGLYPGLGSVPRVLYFHENQLTYPTRGPAAERDTHFGFTQMTSALAATWNLFNSHFNRESFLAAGVDLLRRMPDARPVRWGAEVAARSSVLGLPLELPPWDLGAVPGEPSEEERRLGPILLFNHRWEHDKNPGEFCATLAALRAEDVPFRVIVCGESSRDEPPEIDAARHTLADRIVHWGFAGDRATYVALLRRADAVVSTAQHEFFGVAVLEATWCGARPVVPDRLVYPELFPARYLYTDLTATLREMCVAWSEGRCGMRADRRSLVAPFCAERIVPAYHALFARLVAARR